MTLASAEDFISEVTSLHQQAMASRSRERLLSILAEGCWIYGAGGYGRTVRRLMECAGIAIHGFIDQRGQAADADGLLEAIVVRPDEVDGTAVGGVLVLGLHNFAVDQRPVLAWARRAGFRDIVTPGELVDLLGAAAASYWLTDRGHALRSADALGDLWSSLADDSSRAVLASLVRYRSSGHPDLQPDSCLDDQYFPADLPPLSRPTTLLDGGAFIGDTHQGAQRNGVAIDKWLAFEPDAANFAALSRYAASIDGVDAALFPCGLGDGLHMIQFTSDASAGSRAASGGESNASTVQVVAADQVLPNAAPTLIKLDVEGYERQALDGMRSMIARSRPRLAVSVYHEPADLWEIPAKVAGMMPGARLYLRQHGFNGFDTVLYALYD